MKKIFILIILTIIYCSSISAQGLQLTEFFEKIETYEKEYKELYDKGKYAEAMVPLTEVVNFLDTTTIYKNKPQQIKEGTIKQIKADEQYNLACCYALTGHKKNALSELGKSVENGFKDYNNMLNDSDFISIRNDKTFKKLLVIVKSHSPLEVLKRANTYSKEDTTSILQFKYASKDDDNLKKVREYFKLDTIPGKGNELEYIKNIMHFAHDNIRHNGSNYALCESDAIDIYNYNKATGKGVNCRQLALALCEMYLAEGFKARAVTCMPADPDDPDCHVINTVYSETLHKWLYIDPTFDAWVTDENGTMLSIAEVRESLINGKPLVLCETANWNHEQKQTKEQYLESYMAKNMYYFQCSTNSCFNQESRYRSTGTEYIRLMPVGFDNKVSHGTVTTNPDLFWAKPISSTQTNLSRYKGVYASDIAEAVITDSVCIFYFQKDSTMQAILEIPSLMLHHKTIFSPNGIVSFTTEVEPLKIEKTNNELNINGFNLEKVEDITVVNPYKMDSCLSKENVGNCLQQWRLGTDYEVASNSIGCQINTNRNMFVYMVQPNFVYLRAAAARNNNNGTLFFQNIRMMKNKNTDEYTMYFMPSNLKFTKSNLEIDDSKFHPNSCTFNHDGGIYWSLVSYTSGKILINGCGETYVVNRPQGDSELIEWIKYEPYQLANKTINLSDTDNGIIRR